MISSAIDLAEKQLQDGTAASQVITHYLKLGSTREKLEQERISSENEVLKARVEAMLSSKRIEVLYEEALNAMRNYSGNFVPQEEIKFLQKLSDSISLLAIHNLITDSKRVKCYEKLIKKIHNTLVKYAKIQDSSCVPTA